MLPGYPPLNHHHHNDHHHRQVREYRAKFASLFSAIERRGPMDQGGPLTVAEALPEAAASAAEDAGAGHSTTECHYTSLHGQRGFGQLRNPRPKPHPHLSI